MDISADEKQNCEEILKNNLLEIREKVVNIEKLVNYCYSKKYLSYWEKQFINNNYVCPTAGDKWDKISDYFIRTNIKTDDLIEIFKKSENNHLLQYCGLNSSDSKIVKLKEWNVSEKNGTFTGRKGLLKEIVGKFGLNLSTKERNNQLTNSTHKLVLYGMCGTGKSSLALQFLHENKDKFNHIFWFNAENREILNSQLLELVTHLGLFQKNYNYCQSSIDFTKILKILKNFISKINPSNDWITVYDNARNWEDIEEIVYAFGGYTLITSRDPNVLPNAPKENLIKISGFDPEDSEKFISAILGNDFENKMKLATELDNYPLALYHACFYIREYHLSITDYFQFHFNNNNKKQGLDFLYKNSQGEPKSIIKSCSISLEKISEESKVSYEWLQICGNLISEKIPKILLDEFLNCKSCENEYLEIRKWILQFGLVQWNQENETYSIHRMVHRVVRAGISNIDQIEIDEITIDLLLNVIQKLALRNLKESNIFNHARHFLYYKLETFSNSVNIDPVKFQGQNDKIVRLINNLINYLEEMDGIDVKFKDYCQFASKYITKKSKLFQLYTTLGLCCNSRGDLTNSKIFYEKSLEFTDANSYSSADANHCLANIHQICGDFEKAQNYFEQSFQIEIKNKPIAHFEDLDIYFGCLLNNFGLSYYEMGNYDEALTVFDNARKIFVNNDSNNLILGKILTNIGLIYNKKGIYHEALEHFKLAKEIKIKNFGKDHVSLLSTFNGIGNALKSQGKLNEAFQSYEKARSIAELLPEKNPDLATVYINIADSYMEIGSLEPAQKLYNKALQIFEKQFGSYFYKSSAIYLGFGNYYTKTNEIEKAMEFYEKSLSIVESFYDPNHPQIAKVLLNIVKNLLDKGDLNNSSKYLEQTESILIDNFGEDHLETASVYYMKGVLNLKNGKYRPALEYLKKTLQIQEKTYSKYHAYKADTLNALGIVYGKLNQSKDQLDCYEKCLQIKELHFGKHDEELVGILSNIGGVYRENGEFDKCLEIYEKASEIKWRNVKFPHIFTGNAINNIGDIYEIKHDYKKALEYYSEALKIYNQNYGEGHFLANFILVEIGIVHEKLGNSSKAYEYFEKALKIFRENENSKMENDENYIYCEGKYYQYCDEDSNFKNAIHKFKEYLKIISEQDGDESISLLNCLWDLAQLNHKIGQKVDALFYFEKIQKIEIKYFQKPTFESKKYINSITGDTIQA